MNYYRRHRNLLLTGAALLWALAFGLSSLWAQASTALAASAPKADTDKVQSAPGQGGDKPDTVSGVVPRRTPSIATGTPPGSLETCTAPVAAPASTTL